MRTKPWCVTRDIVFRCCDDSCLTINYKDMFLLSAPRLPAPKTGGASVVELTLSSYDPQATSVKAETLEYAEFSPQTLQIHGARDGIPGFLSAVNRKRVFGLP